MYVYGMGRLRQHLIYIFVICTVFVSFYFLYLCRIFVFLELFLLLATRLLNLVTEPQLN